MSTCDKNSNTITAANPASSNVTINSLQINKKYNPNLFDPNKILAGLQNYNALNFMVNQTLGIEVRWFRAIPQQRSKDVILGEYTLSNVAETPLCIKVIPPSGSNQGESKYQYDLMGLEYEVPYEVQIDKKYWESIAGFGTAPQKDDIVYIPLSNKLYDIESSYLKRGFMEQETTWIINLKKHQDKASRRESEELKETIDMYTTSTEELFGDSINNEIEKLTNDKQFSALNSTIRDKYKIIDSSLTILPVSLDIHGFIVAQSYYDLSSTIKYNAIQYKTGDNIKSTDDRSISAWFSPKEQNETYDIYSIEESSDLPIPANYIIKIKGAKKFSLGNVLHIFRQGSLNFYAKIVDDSNSSNGTYYCKIDDDIIDYLNGIKSDWTTLSNYKVKNNDPINIIDSVYDDRSNFKIDIYANQFVKIIYGSQEYTSILPTINKLQYGNWYGIVINIGNSWKQYNINIYKESNNSNDRLDVLFNETIKFKPEAIYVEEYNINRSPAYLTNIRLYKCTIEEDKQVNELLSYISKDADQAILLDSAEPRLDADYINRPR